MRNRILSVFGFLSAAAGFLLLIAGQDRRLVWLFVLLGACLSFFPLRLVVQNGDLREALEALLGKLKKLPARLRRKSGSSKNGRFAADEKDAPKEDAPKEGAYDAYLNMLLKELQKEQQSKRRWPAESGSPETPLAGHAPAGPATSDPPLAGSAPAEHASAAPPPLGQDRADPAQDKSDARQQRPDPAQARDFSRGDAGEAADASEERGKSNASGGYGASRRKNGRTPRSPHFNEDFFKQERFRYESAPPTQAASAPAILFFKGVENEEDLKKRYRDLLKIYHPDNHTGDEELTLAIQKEYDYLLSAFSHV